VACARLETPKTAVFIAFSRVLHGDREKKGEFEIMEISNPPDVFGSVLPWALRIIDRRY
jgi:hypothetical protein